MMTQSLVVTAACFFYLLALSNAEKSCNSPLPNIQKTLFGRLDSTGEPVYKFTITNVNNNVSASFTEYGAHLLYMRVPDATGKLDNVLVGYKTLAGLLNDTAYMGAMVGRYGMRIIPPVFSLPNGENNSSKQYKVDENEPGGSLHGGFNAFDKKLWQGSVMPTGVLFERISADGENGYPGELYCAVLYQLTSENEVVIDVSARLLGGKSTLVNIFNHAYFNLAGEASADKIFEHKIALHAKAVTKYSAKPSYNEPIALVPIEQQFSETIFDLGKLDYHMALEKLRNLELKYFTGYDHSFLLQYINTSRDAEPSASPLLMHAATVTHPTSGRTLDVFTTQPFIHLYTGNYLNAKTETGKVLSQYSAFCLETCMVSNAPNNNKLFPSATLAYDDIYTHRSVYKFGTMVDSNRY